MYSQWKTRAESSFLWSSAQCFFTLFSPFLSFDFALQMLSEILKLLRGQATPLREGSGDWDGILCCIKKPQNRYTFENEKVSHPEMFLFLLLCPTYEFCKRSLGNCQNIYLFSHSVTFCGSKSQNLGVMIRPLPHSSPIF